MRQFVFALFMLLLFGLIALAFVFVATVVVRGGFSVAHAFFTNGVPAILAVMQADPWYVPALIIGALLVWSYPWEQQSGDYNPVRRGRQVTSRRPAYRASSRRPTAAASRKQRAATANTRRHTWNRAKRTNVGRAGSSNRKWN